LFLIGIHFLLPFHSYFHSAAYREKTPSASNQKRRWHRTASIRADCAMIRRAKCRYDCAMAFPPVYLSPVRRVSLFDSCGFAWTRTLRCSASSVREGQGECPCLKH
jgi:hypothetical protein